MEVAKGESAGKNKEDEDVLPGFRFHPTDEELVGFYLRRKVEQKPLRIEIIKQTDIYKYDPWDLPKVSSVVGDKEWYFFCIRGRKYRNSIRPNRVTGSGFWKATGIDKPIYSVKEPHECIGLKKSLVYYRGSAGKGTKTDWMMHEFRLPPNAKPNSSDHQPNAAPSCSNLHEAAEVWTLCRIFKRVPSYKKYTPNLKGTAAGITKPNAADSNSKTCSLESDNSGNPYLTYTFNDSFSVVQQDHERKPTIAQVFDYDQRNHLFLGQFGSISQVPPTTPVSYPYPTFWNNPNVEDVFANGNWDELRSVIQFANIDPNPSTIDGL